MRTIIPIWAACLITSTVLSVAAPQAAEIYKWTDEHGNVHFGDKPKDQSEADAAEKVEVREGYTPPERSEEELESIRAAHQERLGQEGQRRLEEQQQADQERAERAEKQAELCGKYAEMLRNLTEHPVVEGQRSRYFVADEEGRPLSNQEQEKIIADLKQKSAEAGCSDADSQ